MKKEAYTAPILRAHGHVESMTKGGSNGTVLDAFFPVGTPFADITLS